MTKVCFLMAVALGALLLFSCSKEPVAVSGHPVEFTLDDFSTKGQAAITTLETLAAQAGTISYELLCAVSPRVPRASAAPEQPESLE